VQSQAFDNIPKSKRITVWAEAGRLLEDREFGSDLRNAMSHQEAKSEWMEVVITDWNPEGWDENYLKLFHPLGSNVWLNEYGKPWDHKANGDSVGL